MDINQTNQRRRGGLRNPPGGRPKGSGSKISADARILAAAYASEAIDKLVAIMRDPTAAHAAQAACARELLDRACGRPAQAITATIETRELKDMSDAELLAIIQAGREAAPAIN
jgi:hypothetical protein